jgi:hypothetical protein
MHGGGQGQQQPGQGGQNNPQGGGNPGGGGPGQGQREIGDLDSPEQWEAARIRGKPGQGGRIVGSYLTRGTQVKGESQAEYQEVVGAAAAKASEALDKTRIPRRLADQVRDYIDSITPERQ